MYQLIMTALLTLSFSLFAQAQDVGVKVNNIDATQDTTISIKKGDATTKKKWILTEDEEDITGNKDVVMKNAKKN
jgi:hypothetical protein